MRPHSAHATPRHATPHTPRARACAHGPDPPYLEGTRSPHVAPIARPAQVLHAEGVRPPTMDELPADFFTLSPAEAKAMLSASAAKREQASVNGNNRYTSLAPSSASCSTNASTSRRSSTTTTLKTVARASAQESVLRTKETREAEAAKRRRVYRKALIRVRFADGLMLQATFSVKAPVSRLLRWVANSLREPHHAFELSIARGETLDDPAKTIEQVPPTRPSAHALGAFPRRIPSANSLGDSSRRRWTSRRRRCSTSAYPRLSSSTLLTFAPTFARPSSSSPTRRYRKDRAGSRTLRRAPTCHRRTLSRARCRSGPRAVPSRSKNNALQIARGRLARG